MGSELTPLIVTMVSVGVGLAGLMIGLFAWIRADMRRMEDRINQNIADHRKETAEAIGELRKEISDHRKETGGHRKETGADIAELRERMAHLEGLLEGLREAIVSRAAA